MPIYHDDLYLGSESGTPPGYVDRDLLDYWEAKDPLVTHRQLLQDLGVPLSEIETMESEEMQLVENDHKALLEMEWPEPENH